MGRDLQVYMITEENKDKNAISQLVKLLKI